MHAELLETDIESDNVAEKKNQTVNMLAISTLNCSVSLLYITKNVCSTLKCHTKKTIGDCVRFQLVFPAFIKPRLVLLLLSRLGPILAPIYCASHISLFINNVMLGHPIDKHKPA